MSERPQAKILLLEDEVNVGSTLHERLQSEGYEVFWAQSIAEAQDLLQDSRFELALLDVGLPDGSGFGVAEKIKASHRMTAIIFLTAFAGPEDRIKGLELGAEDYVAKPFHFKELLLRIQNGLRRARYLTSSTDTDVKIGAAVFHFSRFEVQVGDRIVPLTHKECALMRFLFERRGKTVSRDEILNEIWSENEFPTTRTVDNFIMRLRRLVESDPENPQTIRSIRGVGYQLEK